MGLVSLEGKRQCKGMSRWAQRRRVGASILKIFISFEYRGHRAQKRPPLLLQALTELSDRGLNVEPPYVSGCSPIRDRWRLEENGSLALPFRGFQRQRCVAGVSRERPSDPFTYGDS